MLPTFSNKSLNWLIISFLRNIFWCGPFLKSLWNLSQHCFCFMFCFFWLWGMLDLSSPTRNQICTPCIERGSPNHGTAGEVPIKSILISLFGSYNIWVISRFGSVDCFIMWQRLFFCFWGLDFLSIAVNHDPEAPAHFVTVQDPGLERLICSCCWSRELWLLSPFWVPRWLSGKELVCQCRRCKNFGFEKSPAGRNGNSL